MTFSRRLATPPWLASPPPPQVTKSRQAQGLLACAAALLSASSAAPAASGPAGRPPGPPERASRSPLVLAVVGVFRGPLSGTLYLYVLSLLCIFILTFCYFGPRAVR